MRKEGKKKLQYSHNAFSSLVGRKIEDNSRKLFKFLLYPQSQIKQKYKKIK